MGRTSTIFIFIVALCFSSLLCGRAYATAPWSFAVIGDTRGEDTSTTTGVSTYLPAIASKIVSVNPSAVFVTGDLINGDDLDILKIPFIPYATQFANWGVAMQPVINAGVPIYTVRGNHENAALELGPPIAALQSAYFNAFGTTDTTKLIQPLVIVPQNGLAGQVGYTWNLALNNIRVIAVDQYFYYKPEEQTVDGRHYYQIDQDWLNTQLTTSPQKQYTFVMTHEPAYTLDDQGNFYGDPDGASNRDAYWASLGSNGVKMVLNCHVHALLLGTAQDANGNTIYQSVTGNGGATPLVTAITPESSYNSVITDTTNFGFALFTVSDNGIIVDYYTTPNPSLGPWSVGYALSFDSNLQNKATNSNAAVVASALNNTIISADMSNVLKTLEASSDSQIASSLDAMSPIADRGVIETTNQSLDKFVGQEIIRLQDSKVEEDKDQNKSSEDKSFQNDIWTQVYGDYAHQDARGLSNGYLARLWGTVIGIDHKFMDDSLRLGLAEGFSGSQVLSKDNSGHTGITSYQTGLYAEYEGKKRPFILDVLLTYGYNNYDSSRIVDLAGTSRTASSNYIGQQFSTYLEAGYKFKSKNFDIIPLLALDYTHLHLSDYTESGADSLDLSVDAQNYDTLQVGTGCRISHAFETKNMLFTPELHFRYFYAAVNDKQQTLASFTGGGTTFQTNGYRPAPSSFNFGARLEFFNKKNLTLLADCNTAFKDGYYEAGGSLTVKYSF